MKIDEWESWNIYLGLIVDRQLEDYLSAVEEVCIEDQNDAERPGPQPITAGLIYMSVIQLKIFKMTV